MQPFFGNASPIGRSNLRSPLEEAQNREREGATRAVQRCSRVGPLEFYTDSRDGSL